MTDVYKIAAWIPVSQEVLTELDQRDHPWRYPDPPALGKLDPFPTLTRLADGARRARNRFADIVYVARHGIPEDTA